MLKIHSVGKMLQMRLMLHKQQIETQLQKIITTNKMNSGNLMQINTIHSIPTQTQKTTHLTRGVMRLKTS